MASTAKLQDVVNSLRSYPELAPVLGVGGWSQEPALTIANDIMQRILREPLNWKWNRKIVKPFITVSLQQDYITSVTDMAWLEQGWRQDINNTSLPQPVYALETVRDLAKTYYQQNPFFCSWIPNSLAIFGTWQKSTLYPSGLNQPFTPVSPIQQFIDVNGNFLYVTGYGTSGSGSAPSLPANSTAGTTVADGSVTWTVADPNGIALRLAPLPAQTGIVWQISANYQVKPPILTSLQNTLAPIPDEFLYLFRQGMMAQCLKHAGSSKARDAYMEWEEDIIKCLRSGDREREDMALVPSEGLTGGMPWNYPYPVGPAWPYTSFPG